MIKGFQWLCDSCKTVVHHELKHSYEDRYQRIKAGGLIVERSRKGHILHFCGLECCKAHRGKHAGQGRIYPTL